MNTLTLKPLGFWRDKTHNSKAYKIIIKFTKLDVNFKQFVLDTYKRANLRGLNNCYKILNIILNSAKMKLVKTLHKNNNIMSNNYEILPNHRSKIGNVINTTSITDLSPQQRLQNIKTHISHLPKDYFNMDNPVSMLADICSGDTVDMAETYKKYEEYSALYNERQLEFEKLKGNYIRICKLCDISPNNDWDKWTK